MHGLPCWSILKDELVDTKTDGALFGEREPLPAERGRETWSAVGGPFLAPLRIDLLRAFDTRAGTGGGSSDGSRLVEGDALIKLGLGN